MIKFLKKIIFFSFLYTKGIKKPRSPSIIPIIHYLRGYFRKKPLKVLEIGARFGESSKVILHSLNVSEYVIIDPYQEYDEYINDPCNEIIKNVGGDNIFNKVSSELKAINNKVTFIREFSDSDAVFNAIKNNKFDLIFVDGNHEYSYVLKDIQNYFPYLNKGGIICGDDFHDRSKSNDYLGSLPHSNERPMVYEAVMEFEKESGRKHFGFGSHRGYNKTFAFKND